MYFLYQNNPQYPTHFSININSDDDFESNGFPGSGTEGDPYIIENYTYEDYLNSITIGSVDKYFIIQNNIIATDSLSCIVVYDVEDNRTRILNNLILGKAYSGIDFEGIRIANTNGCFLANNTIQNKEDGILVLNSDKCYISHNVLSNEENNLQIINSNYTIIENNRFFFNKEVVFPHYNLGSIYMYNSLNTEIINNTFKGSGIWFSSNCLSGLTIADNSINGKNLFFTANQNGLNFNETDLYGQIILYNCSNITLEKLNFTQIDVAIHLINCPSVNISNCGFIKNLFSGVYASNCPNLTINDCTFDLCYVGINLDHSNYTLIQDSVFSNNFYGFIEGQSTNITYYNNEFMNNSYDIS
jgi:parallel beta-helix repeat protein